MKNVSQHLDAIYAEIADIGNRIARVLERIAALENSRDHHARGLETHDRHIKVNEDRLDLALQRIDALEGRVKSGDAISLSDNLTLQARVEALEVQAEASNSLTLQARIEGLEARNNLHTGGI